MIALLPNAVLTVYMRNSRRSRAIARNTNDYQHWSNSKKKLNYTLFVAYTQ